ncbi:hypothetical protein RIF29_09890 [Crotalaria pallida]|uniref:Uncharacterized protein n=1 Tax=Crotalaria pallida TaxID=3830 RepID=A0AAN9FV70_CROPI
MVNPESSSTLALDVGRQIAGGGGSHSNMYLKPSAAGSVLPEQSGQRHSKSVADKDKAERILNRDKMVQDHCLRCRLFGSPTTLESLVSV